MPYFLCLDYWQYSQPHVVPTKIHHIMIMMVFMVQGASAGIIGALLGAVLGALLASQLNNLMPIIGVLLDGAALPVAIEPLQVIVIALVAMAIALLSTL